MAKKLEVPEKGFFYYDPKHAYYLDGEKMTGVTTILDGVGDKSNLIQWAANQAAAIAIMEAASIDITSFAKALARYPKLSSQAAMALDKAFPGFKAARHAHTRIKDTAADSGKEAHKICELYETGETMVKDSWSPQAWHRFGIYRTWYDENVLKTHFVERPLFSRTHFVGGTPDGGFLLKNGQSLINDKKFKDRIYDSSPFRQMAAYRMMLEEMATDTSTPIRLDWGDRVEEYASPKEYLGSLGDVVWSGAVVLRVGEDDFEEMHANDYQNDRARFLEALGLYRDNGAFKNRLTKIL